MTDPSHLRIVPPVDYDTRPNLYDSLTERERKALDGYREPVLDRVASALGSERALFIEIGFVLGCFCTVGFAFLWSVL